MPTSGKSNHFQVFVRRLKGSGFASKKLSSPKNDLPRNSLPEEVLPYKYAPLQDVEIRVVHLLPGAFDDDIHLRLVHERLLLKEEDLVSKQPSRKDVEQDLPEGWRAFQTPEGRWWFHSPSLALRLAARTQINMTVNGPKYEALSYAWGDTSRHHLAYIESNPNDAKNNIQTTYSLKIADNLNTALRHLRSDVVRALWIDAICIEQESTSERSAQVSRIPQIYKQAWRVVMWLGPASEDSELALDTLNILGQQVEISVDSQRCPAKDASYPDWFHSMFALPYSQAQWSAIANLVNRPFFKRLWILQEVAIAGKNAVLLCGRGSIPWFSFRRATATLSQKVAGPSLVKSAVGSKRFLNHGDTTIPLVEVMFLARYHDCSNTHDKLYGLWAFLGPVLRQSLQPSYGKSFESAFEELFWTYSQLTNRLDVLTGCYFSEDNHGLPSFVPDWRSYPKDFMRSGRLYQAAGLSPATLRLMSPGILVVDGSFCGDVISLSEAAYNDESSIKGHLGTLIKTVKHITLYLTGEKALDAWAKTLLAGNLRSRYSNFTGFPASQDWISAVKLLISGDERSEMLSGLDRLTNSYRDVVTNMKFFTTQAGHFGFGQLNMMQGDRACVLLGLFTPVVVRFIGDHYQIVGWCYMHGMMDCEALLGPLPRGWSVEFSDRHGRLLPYYKNISSSIVQVDDPRLDALPAEWQRIDVEFTADDPVLVDYFKNTRTGEVINYDPRMTAEKLRERGVKLEAIRLV